MLVRRASDNGTQAIGWNGKDCDVAAFNSFCNATTCWLNTWYDQSGNGNNCVQTTTSRQWQVIVDADGKLSPGTSANGKGCEIADNSSYKTAQVHSFVVINGDNSVYTDQSPQSIIGYMPTGESDNVARWGLEWWYSDSDGMIYTTRNASTLKNFSGQAYRRSQTSNFTIWDHSTFDQKVLIDVSHALTPNGTPSNASVTYGASSLLMVGNNRAYNNSFHGRMRAVVLYGTTRADRQNISAYLQSVASLNFPSIPWTFAKDGFIWTANFIPTWDTDPTDLNGLQWWHEFGGYDWSFAKAATSNNTELVRFEVRPFDTDTIVTGAERAERGGQLAGNTGIVKGNDFEEFAQFKIEDGPTQTGSWCLTFQIHYGGGASPDIFFLDLKNNNFQVNTQRNGGGASQSSAIPYARNTWYAMRVSGHWSTNGTSDTLKVWLGPNGGTLTQITNASGSLFSTDTSGAYVKQGIYRGDTGDNSGNIAIQIANQKFSLTSGAYTSYVTAQPALPAPLANTLVVSPATDIAASSTPGGPFSPSSFQYQLSASSGSIGYSISGVPSWLTASSTSGTLTTSPIPVTFTVNSNANTLPTGTYGPSTITFTNTTNGSGNTTQAATLTVTPPGLANDYFANATTIQAGQTLTGSNVSATKETGEPNLLSAAAGKSVWWNFTAPVSGSFNVNTIGSNFDTILGIYTGNAVNALTLISADDDSGGNYTSSTTFTATAGTTYHIMVDGYIASIYGDSGNIQVAVSGGPSQQATTTTLASTPNPSVYGQSVTFTATVSSAASGTPSGTVTFKDGATTLGTGPLSGGTATFSTAALAIGGHTITAVYGGDTSFTASTSSGLTQTVGKAATTTAVAGTPNPSTSGQSVTFTATVSSAASGTPSGTVTFKDGATTLGTGPLSGGTATFSTAALAIGGHTITAVYGGDTSFTASTSSGLTQTVGAANVYVSARTGTDTGLCPATAPCATLNYALSVTGGGGQVTIIDGGLFGPIVLTQDISIIGSDPRVPVEIVADPTASVGCVGGAPNSCGGNSGFGVEIAAGVNDTVKLTNVTVTVGLNGTGALKLSSGGKIQISDDIFLGNQTATGPIVALYPNNSGATQAEVYFSFSDVGFSDNTNAGAIEAKPSGNTSLKLHLNHVEVHNASYGIRTDASLLSGPSVNLTVTVSDSKLFSFAFSAINVFSTAGTGMNNATFDSVKIQNANVAIKANGPQSTAILTNSTISGNGIGAQIQNGGVVFSPQSNTIAGNGTDLSGSLSSIAPRL